MSAVTPDGGLCHACDYSRTHGASPHVPVDAAGEPVPVAPNVTDADENLVRGLGSRPALARLRELYEAADETERALLGQGLHVGVAVDERTERFGPGDFVIRGILDTDEAHV